MYRFVERERAVHHLATVCRVLGVSRAGYLAWASRGPSERAAADARLLALIGAVHRASRGTYGAPRVHAELAAAGTRVGRKRVARLMRTAGLVGVHRRRRVRVVPRPARPTSVAPDLVRRNFRVAGPDRLWVADITYLPTGAGFLHLAAIVDAWSRRVVGWSMAPHVRTELVLEALEAALAARRPRPGLIHHSDRGTQYTSLALGSRLAEAGIAASMGAPGTAYDNALAESFFASLETELIDRS
ncbi:MAG TPA: IS3 family transposase, partial [Candidatus Limnocylindrales bacterium]|nr:IS3 family transposase [Candidatus Limnocylindrales bacterium]